MRIGILAMSAPVAMGLTTPPWDYTPAHQRDICVTVGTDQRWAFLATPDGAAPAAGWPLYVHFVTDLFSPTNKSATCGSGAGGYGGPKPFLAFATPNETLQTCFPNGTASTDAAPAVGDACDDAMTATCSAAAKSGFAACLACAKPAIQNASCTDIAALAWCAAHGGGHHPPHGGGKCDYDQEAGALWDQRLKQILVANGIAVLQLNPYSTDTWDNFPEAWAGYAAGSKTVGGVDRLYLPGLFAQLKSGAMGPLDVGNTVLRGWSSGAHMVSWLYQVFAVNGTTLFPGVTIKGGVMLSGASYACYNDPQSTPEEGPPLQPVGSCQGCTEGGPGHCDSRADPLCSSCVATTKTYCGQCCPRNYTEAYYAEDPARYAAHPPTFLAQTSTVDNHADLCACKHYHETLVAHGVKSVLSLIAEEDESCFCVGTPANAAAAGSPYAAACNNPDWGTACSTMGGTDCCIAHTLGFASMVNPAAAFVLDVTATAAVE